MQVSEDLVLKAAESGRVREADLVALLKALLGGRSLAINREFLDSPLPTASPSSSSSSSSSSSYGEGEGEGEGGGFSWPRGPERLVHLLARLNQPQALQVILYHGARAGFFDARGMTPLHIAVAAGHSLVTRVLAGDVAFRRLRKAVWLLGAHVRMYLLGRRRRQGLGQEQGREQGKGQEQGQTGAKALLRSLNRSLSPPRPSPSISASPSASASADQAQGQPQGPGVGQRRSVEFLVEAVLAESRR